MRSNWISSFVNGKADVLLRHGLIDQQAMRRHDVSSKDVEEALRIQRLEGPDLARLVTFERGGKIRVIPRDG